MLGTWCVKLMSSKTLRSERNYNADKSAQQRNEIIVDDSYALDYIDSQYCD